MLRNTSLQRPNREATQNTRTPSLAEVLAQTQIHAGGTAPRLFTARVLPLPRLDILDDLRDDLRGKASIAAHRLNNRAHIGIVEAAKR